MSLVLEKICQTPLKNIAEKIFNQQRLTEEDALTLYESPDLLSIGALADYARKIRVKSPAQDYAYFVNNLHINLTNICEGSCKFCAYRKKKGDEGSYFLSETDVEEYLNTYVLKNVKELHIVSALNENANLNYYKKLFKKCKEILPEAHIQALTAVEIDYISKNENLEPPKVLTELKKAGLGSLPGGGAEIFHETIRLKVCPDKVSADRWLEIMKIAHSCGIPSNATMLAGIGESYAHRVDHLSRIRSLQDETGGFMTFIPLVCHYENTSLEVAKNNTGVDNLKDLAIARLYLDNVPHVKAFWIQLGLKMAQLSLAFGVDDLDGTVVKEQISRAAGADKTHTVTVGLLIDLIKSASRIPVERDTVYNIIKVYR